MPNDLADLHTSVSRRSAGLTRRVFGAGLAACGTLVLTPMPAFAISESSARALVDKAVASINDIIASGKSENAMFGDFERLFTRYADVPTIARSALGSAARGATPQQLSAFTKAYQGYVSRKYGRRFREFIGGRIEVTDARALKSYYEVVSVAYLQGESPFDLRWHVSDKSGKDLFFNIIIEGINMLSSERAEIGALLDRRGGDVDALIADLRSL